MTERNIHQEDRVALPGLKAVALQFLHFFFKFCAFAVFILFKNKFFITLVLIAGLLGGYFYYLARPEYYKVSMIVQFTDLNKRIYAQMLDQLGAAPKRKLSREMNLSEEAANKILFVDARTMAGEPLSTDTSTRTKQTFTIILGLSSNGVFADSLQYGVLYYLNHSPYLKVLDEEQKKINQQKLARIESDLAKLDTLKMEYNRFLATSKGGGTIYFSAANPADFYAQSQKLLVLREETIQALNVDAQSVTVIDGFKMPERPQSISMPTSVLFFGIVGSLFVFVILSLIEIKKRIARHDPPAVGYEK